MDKKSGRVELTNEPFRKKNLLEENPSNQAALTILFSALLLSGDIRTLLRPSQMNLQKQFLTWLNEMPELRTARINLFYNSYFWRPDRLQLDNYSREEFQELLQILEERNEI